MTKYFIHDGNKEIGPFTLIELTSQNINAQTPIWHRGLHGWTEAGDLEELQPLLASKISPPPFLRNEKRLRPVSGPAKEIPIAWMLGVVVVIAGILFWYFLPTDTATIRPQPVDNTRPKVTDSLQQSSEEAERQRISAELEAKKMSHRNNWSRFIWIKDDKYNNSLLGGIYNLEIRLVNDTEYRLDEVVVLVHYIKENGATYKIEPVSVYNIPAHGESSMPAPDSNRGTSIKIEITAISSRQLNFCYSSDIDIRGSKDPYRCKGS